MIRFLSVRANFLLHLCTLAVAALVAVAPDLASATPITYSYSATVSSIGNTSDPAVASALAALGPNALISGTFAYDSSSPFTGTGSGGVSIYGNAAGTTASFSSLTGSVTGISFSDPRGFVTVGHDEPLGSIASTDSVQFYADTETTSGTHNFSSFSLGSAQVVDLRMFWYVGLPGITSDFLTDQSLPGAPPSLVGRLALDLGSTTSPGFISTNAVFFDNLVVVAQPVPEPDTVALMLAGLALLGLNARRRNAGVASTASRG